MPWANSSIKLHFCLEYSVFLPEAFSGIYDSRGIVKLLISESSEIRIPYLAFNFLWPGAYAQYTAAHIKILGFSIAMEICFERIPFI